MDAATRIKTFLSEAGFELNAITAEQMREVDRVAMEITGPNIFQMMENAGRNLFSLTVEKLGDGWREARILVLAGTGGNGGGGICAARHLVNHGANARLLIGNPERLGEVPAFQRKIYQKAGGVEIGFPQLKAEMPDLIIDALIGYSLESAPAGMAQTLINWANAQDSPKLSLDIPSGVEATTGETPGDFIKADWTMTLAQPKTGLLPDRTGGLYLADLGIPSETYRILNIPYQTPFDRRFYVPIWAKN